MNFDPPKRAEILLVEEDEEDSQWMQAAFAAATARPAIHVVRDGGGALAFLRREDGYATVRRPELILLDLDLSGEEGFALLEKIKADAGLRRIPIIALTDSKSYEDILKAYRLNVNSCILKPSTQAELDRMVLSLQEFWLTIVHLPKE